MRVTWHGHGFFEIDAADGTNILIDPFIEGNPMNDYSRDEFSPDLVAITHTDAFDHADEAHEFGATVLSQGKFARRLKRMGYEKADNMDIGGEYQFNGVTFLMTHAFHSLGTGHQEFENVEYGGVAAGYIIDDGEARFYISGDTGLFGDMKHVIGDIYEPEFAALPIGGRFGMEPKHAAVAAEWIDVDTVIPYHYNTLPALEKDPQEFVDAVAGRCDATVEVLDVGESITYPS